MIMFKNIVYLIALFWSWFGYAQTAEIDQNKNPDFPAEEIYLHLNTNNTFAGENLLYKAYVTTKGNELSKYSKVAYVRLIDPNNTIVLKQKVRLTQGQGYGDFFIPTDIPTGNYKLIAYTIMGLRQQASKAFVADISIINPYIPIDPDLVSVIDKNPFREAPSSASNTDSKIKISLSDSILEKRKKIEVKLFVNDDNNYGNYSISVKKADSFQYEKPTSILKHENHQKTIKAQNPLGFLPELRGELFTGKIIPSNQSTPVDYQSLALLIPEKDFILKLGRTDKEGRFFFSIEKAYSSNTAFLQVLNEYSEDYSFEIDQEPVLDLSTLSFEKLKLYQGFKEQILDKSIKNQIENSYSSIKPNQPIIKQQPPFFGNRGMRYNLDDFTRFPTLNETFVEIIKGVSFKKSGNGYEIKARATDDFYQSPLKTMVLINGLLIQDHSPLNDFNAFEIQYINVIKEKYYYGGSVFQGVVSIITVDSKYQDKIKPSHIKPIKIDNPELEKTYHKVDYTNNNLNHIPDFRTQLFWEPNLNITSPNILLDFFTSDESGVYEITLEGISNNGERIRAKTFFRVLD